MLLSIFPISSHSEGSPCPPPIIPKSAVGEAWRASCSKTKQLRVEPVQPRSSSRKSGPYESSSAVSFDLAAAAAAATSSGKGGDRHTTTRVSHHCCARCRGSAITAAAITAISSRRIRRKVSKVGCDVKTAMAMHHTTVLLRAQLKAAPGQHDSTRTKAFSVLVRDIRSSRITDQ